MSKKKLNLLKNSMKEINYVIWNEGKHYIAQCLNVEISSFGDSIDEARKNIKEAIELYFEGETDLEIQNIDSLFLGKEVVNA
jgi:predicted RNase H-like HicB family nuclease